MSDYITNPIYILNTEMLFCGYTAAIRLVVPNYTATTKKVAESTRVNNQICDKSTENAVVQQSQQQSVVKDASAASACCVNEYPNKVCFIYLYIKG